MLDIVVLGLRRKCFSELMDSFIKHFNKGRQDLRLVLHIDYLDCYNTYDIESDIKKYSYLFKESIIKIENFNIGHTKSWIWCLKNIENDFIYLEDDKLFFKNISLDNILNRKTDAVSLEGARGRLGNLESFYAIKKIRDYLLENYFPEECWLNTDAERMNKIILRDAKFTYSKNKRTKCVGGTGMDSLSENKLIRIRKGRSLNSPIYIPTPDNISYILHGEENKKAKRLREFYLCINSFPVFNYETLNLDDIKTSHIGIMSRSCLTYAAVTWLLDYNDIKKYDIYGSLQSNKYIFYIKADILRECFNKDIESTIILMWEFADWYNHNYKPIQELGFEL